MVTLQRWSVYSHVTDLITLMKGEWSYNRGGQFKERRMVKLRRSLQWEEEWSCYRGGQFNGAWSCY